MSDQEQAKKPETNYDRERWRRMIMEHTGKLNDAELSLVDQIFTYQIPRPDQVEAFKEVKAAMVAAAAVVLQYAPPSPDRTAAINLIRDARMRANAAIALDGRA